MHEYILKRNHRFLDCITNHALSCILHKLLLHKIRRYSSLLFKIEPTLLLQVLIAFDMNLKLYTNIFSKIIQEDACDSNLKMGNTFKYVAR